MSWSKAARRPWGRWRRSREPQRAARTEGRPGSRGRPEDSWCRCSHPRNPSARGCRLVASRGEAEPKEGVAPPPPERRGPPTDPPCSRTGAVDQLGGSRPRGEVQKVRPMSVRSREISAPGAHSATTLHAAARRLHPRSCAARAASGDQRTVNDSRDAGADQPGGGAETSRFPGAAARQLPSSSCFTTSSRGSPPRASMDDAIVSAGHRARRVKRSTAEEACSAVRHVCWESATRRSPWARGALLLAGAPAMANHDMDTSRCSRRRGCRGDNDAAVRAGDQHPARARRRRASSRFRFDALAAEPEASRLVPRAREVRRHRRDGQPRGVLKHFTQPSLPRARRRVLPRRERQAPAGGGSARPTPTTWRNDCAHRPAAASRRSCSCCTASRNPTRAAPISWSTASRSASRCGASSRGLRRCRHHVMVQGLHGETGLGPGGNDERRRDARRAAPPQGLTGARSTSSCATPPVISVERPLSGHLAHPDRYSTTAATRAQPQSGREGQGVHRAQGWDALLNEPTNTLWSKSRAGDVWLRQPARVPAARRCAGVRKRSAPTCAGTRCADGARQGLELLPRPAHLGPAPILAGGGHGAPPPPLPSCLVIRGCAMRTVCWACSQERAKVCV